MRQFVHYVVDKIFTAQKPSPIGDKDVRSAKMQLLLCLGRMREATSMLQVSLSLGLSLIEG